MSTVTTHGISEADRASMARIDATGWGVFFIWVGIALVASVGWGLALLGMGAISLAVQLARRRASLPVDWSSVGFGACLSAVGMMLWLDIPLGRAPVPTWAVPAAFAALGVAILLSTWLRKPGPK